MKRLSLLLLAAILSLGTVGFAPPAAEQPGPSEGAIPGYNIVCHNIRAIRLCASVSEARVTPGSFVTIYGLMRTRGVGVPGEIMRVVWSSNVTVSCLGITDETGLASCTTYVPARTPNARKVHVRVWIDHYKLQTAFMTRHPYQDPRESD
jgi:hypothetical protein